MTIDVRFEPPTFNGLNPPTLACFVAQVRFRYRKALRHAISASRDRERPGWMHFYSFWCGVADGMVMVLYDVNTPDAYDKARRLDRVRQFVVEAGQ